MKMLKISEKSVHAAEISFSTDETTNLEYSVSDLEKCTVEKVAVAAKEEAGKHFKTVTNKQMKQYPILDLRWI